MYIIRPSQEIDFSQLYECALNAYGIIPSLSNKESDLKELLKLSQNSFQKKIDRPGREYYLFILEDLIEKQVCGLSAIRTSSHYELFYLVKDGFLTLIRADDSPTELCSLYISPPFRKSGLGKLLSLSRVHFIASFQSRFKEAMVTEIRGYINEAKNSPFWDHTGRNLLDIRYEEAEELLTTQSPLVNQFVFHEPKEISTLPPAAANVIGKTHPNAQSALEMLKKEGFIWSGGIDIIDGGPRLDVATADLRTLKESKLFPLEKITSFEGGEMRLLSNNRLNFRATYAPVQINANQTVNLTPETAKALQLEPGELIRL